MAETRLVDASRSATGRAETALLLPIAGIFALGIALRHFVVANTDVSWLITLCERVLNGETPYVDFIEVNPPASIILYLLPVAFARVINIAPEIVVDAFVFIGAAVSLWISAAAILSVTLFERRVVYQLAMLFAAAFLLLPAQNFGEREHIVLIAFLPLLAVSAIRAARRPVAWRFALAAGLSGGFAAVVKPHFILAIIFVAVAAAQGARSWRVVFAPEHWIAAVLFAAYVAFVFAVYPAFIYETLPVLADVYVPVRMLLPTVVVATPIYILIFGMIAWLKRGDMFRAPFSLLIASSLGFSISYYVQLKSWSYHSYPMLALALVAAVVAFCSRWPLDSADVGSRMKRRAAATAIALLAGATFIWMNLAVDMRALADTIRSSAPRPTMITIADDLAIGHPLVRQLGGTWVGRLCSQWITTGARVLKARTSDARLHAEYDAYEARDRAMLVEDIRRARPDIILVSRIYFDWLAWANADTALARELEHYRPLDTINKVLVLRRK